MRTTRYLVCAFALGVGACASQPPPRSQPSPLLGSVMPGFESENVSGNPFYSSQHLGRTLVVTFVDADCGACEKTLLAAQETYEDFRDVVVVGVFRQEDAQTARSLAKQHELRFPMLIDGNGAIAKSFFIQDVPRTFVMDAQGRVRWVGGSDVTHDALTSAIYAAR